jgi:DNA-binding IclR family transcriptional regulator
MKDGLGKPTYRRSLGPKSLKSASALRADLHMVRKRGYAIADQEAEAGVAAIAVAIREPHSDRALGTTSIAGPVVRITRDRHAEIASALRASAADFALVWPAGQRKPAADVERGAVMARRGRR